MNEPDPRVGDVRARLHEAYEASGKITDKARAKLDSQNKIYVRDRIGLLFDEGSFVEDGRYANATAAGLPADGVVTGRGTVDGRPAIVVANDPTVKAGSWGARTVEKIVRATEHALRHELPMFWLVDSAGARITDQVELFPGRRGAGRPPAPVPPATGSRAGPWPSGRRCRPRPPAPPPGSP